MAMIEQTSHFLTFENDQDRMELFRAHNGAILVEVMRAEDRRLMHERADEHAYSLSSEEQSALVLWLSQGLDQSSMVD